MGLFEALVSPRLGHVRWRDIRDAVMPGATSVSIAVMDEYAPPATVSLAITQRWAGGGWARMLACPRCARPAGVLRLHEGALRCTRCRPSLTEQQRKKNTRAWRRFDGDLENKLLRAAMRGASGNAATRLAEQLVARDAARVDAAIEEGQAFLDAADAVLAARGAK